MNRCFPCFGDAAIYVDNEREPLLAQQRALEEPLSESMVDAERSVVDKIVDVLAALNSRKLPTQDQLSHFLQALLGSELLQEDKRRVVSGNGPISQEGRKTLGDIRGLVQAFLQFGSEKNADDKFQELYFQVLQIETDTAEREILAAKRAAQRAVDETSEGAGHIEELTSIQSQVAFDSATILHAFRTISETLLKSPSFRLILNDILSIARDVIAHAAADIEHAASQVQEAAADVQQEAESTNDIIDKVINASVNDVKNKGKEVANTIMTATEEAIHDLKNESGDLGNQKEKILQRVQEVILRLQKDSASRGAIRAVLLLVRKYAEIIADAAKRSVDTIIDIAAEVKEGAASNYPPRPYTSTFIDADTDALFVNIKDVLQRLSQGHSSDSLIVAFRNVVHDLDALPAIVEEEVGKNVKEKIPESPISELPSSPLPIEQPMAPTKPKKGKRVKKARIREKKALEKRQTKLSPATSIAQLTNSSQEETTKSRQNVQTFFQRLGTFLDKALNEPDWAVSKDGADSLESLFNDGFELFSAFGEAVADIGEEMITEGAAPAPDPQNELSENEKSRQLIKTHLVCLIDEIEAFIIAAKNDRTTMNVLNNFDAVGNDLYALLFEGVRRGQRSSLGVLSGWTSWAGWAIPRLLRMLPNNVIPIPTVEIKTETIEAGMHALFVQGLAREGTDPVTASLIPDEIVVKQWTEVRIDMADTPSNFSGRPGVQSTSRVKIHMDGVRAKIEGMGYYFKYIGGIVGYQDEGLLSIDVGISGLHEGLAAVVELEIESDNAPLEPIPEIIVIDEESLTETETAFATTSDISELTAAKPAEPLFRVVDVQVAMSDVRCRIDKSKHWILNKLFLEHLAGPMVARMAKQVLEEKICASLDIVSKGLGVVLKEAREKGELRRSKRKQTTSEDEETEDGLSEILSDWWTAILSTGPMLFGRDQVVQSEDPNVRIDVENRTKNTVTSCGVIHTSTTVTTEQPRGTPAMVYNYAIDNLVEVDLPVQDIGGVPKTQEEETVIAVGSGPQLFPGKGGVHGAVGQSDDRNVVERIQDTTREIAHIAVDGLNEGVERIGDIENRWQSKLDAERKSSSTWKSKAFNFQ